MPSVILHVQYVNIFMWFQVTFVPLVPPLAIFMAKHDLVAQFDMSSVNNIICGAAPLSGDIQQILSNRVSKIIVHHHVPLERRIEQDIKDR